MKDSAVQKNLKWSYFNLAAMARCRVLFCITYRHV